MARKRKKKKNTKAQGGSAHQRAIERAKTALTNDSHPESPEEVVARVKSNKYVKPFIVAVLLVTGISSTAVLLVTNWDTLTARFHPEFSSIDLHFTDLSYEVDSHYEYGTIVTYEGKDQLGPVTLRMKLNQSMKGLIQTVNGKLAYQGITHAVFLQEFKWELDDVGNTMFLSFDGPALQKGNNLFIRITTTQFPLRHFDITRLEYKRQ
jgi:hypothetical protein